MWVIKDSDNNICGYFPTKTDAAEYIKEFSRDAVCEQHGSIYTCIDNQRWWYSLRIEELVVGKFIRQPVIENYLGMAHDCMIEQDDIKRIIDDLNLRGIKSCDATMLWHPDALRHLYEDYKLPLPKWFRNKYRQYLL